MRFAEPIFFTEAGVAPVGVAASGFVRVLGSMTAGNVLGGGVLVALVYWFVYLQPERH